VSENTFFVSDALTGRLTEKILAEQSDEDVADDYQAAPSGLVECTVFFKKGKITCTLIGCEMGDDIESVTFLGGVNIWKMLDRFVNKETIASLSLNDDLGSPIREFDMVEKSYKVSLTKCSNDINYELKLIFI